MSYYKPTYERKFCPVCKGSGFKFVTTIDGFDTVKPCDCSEGKQRYAALTRPKQEDKED